MIVRVLVVVVVVLALPVGILLASAVASQYRGPYRDDLDLTDTRPRRPTR